MTHNALTLSLIAAITLGACTAPVDRPLTVDGTRNANFDHDYTTCHAQAASFTNGAGAETAATGALVGAAIGAIDADDELEGALAGAAIGGLVGAAENASSVEEERRNVLIRCMQNRGHDVIG
ncbi:glycine zipper family protein [Shimia sp. R11_0]|uniref:glycine zipper family protein n=1 Tax=Shimia sp. R11_0 TaxID=2821096 RepID=UPI001ADA54D0|nr:glycine zipper family protein [Shimia sp. R11_0]MBO9478301.1 glycine zipper family protein [Shimia sp. R11_0]